MSPLELTVFAEGREIAQFEFDGPVLELGRQRGASEKLYDPVEGRVAIARGNMDSVSRHHVQIKRLEGGRIELVGLSSVVPVHIEKDPGQPLLPGTRRIVTLPVTLRLGHVLLRVRTASADSSAVMLSLPEQTRPPTDSMPSAYIPPPAEDAFKRADLLIWLNSALDVLHSAADGNTFFERTARAAVGMVKLDSATVLMRHGHQWEARASHTAEGMEVSAQSQRVLREMLSRRKTTWEAPGKALEAAGSLAAVTVAIASPILSSSGETVGALYGVRRQGGSSSTLSQFTEVEAMLVELLARGVAAALMRMEREKAHARAEVMVRFRPFFAPVVADAVINNSVLLLPREAPVTVMICDIRGFSRISERLGPGQAADWISDVLDVLTEAVMAEEGVVVDFVGDGLMALWGAPGEQADHAARACRAALAMQAGMVSLEGRWREKVNEPLRLSIGIHTGLAVVGNSGSRHRFKYGARGPAVNLASRIEGATRQLQCPTLISGETQEALGGTLVTRKLARIQVVNIEASVDVHELLASDHPHLPRIREDYERAWAQFVEGRFAECSLTLAKWREVCPEDKPALLLQKRAIHCESEGVPRGHPVLVLERK